MKKKIIIIIIILALSLGIIGGYGIYFFALNKKENVELNKIQELVDKYNEFNKIYDDATDVVYIDKFDNECFKYEGDSVKALEKSREIAAASLGGNSILNDAGENLYICKPKNCKVKKIEKYETIRLDDSKRILKVDLREFGIVKVGDVWKFSYFDVMCEK